MEKQITDIKELEKHFKDIDYFFSDIRLRRYKQKDTLDIFDLNCLNTYRIYKPLKKLLVFYKTKKDIPNDVIYGELPHKFYDLTEEHIKKLEKYYH